MQAITPTQARRARQSSLLLPAASDRTFRDVAQWFAAMQSQDYASGLWSLGARVRGSTQSDVQAAFERREVLRTWPMRGTIHTIAANDARWLLALTAVRALDASLRRRDELGLDAATIERAADVLVDGLAEQDRLTRKEALALLEAHGIDTAGQRGYHLLWCAAQTGRICIGPNIGADQTFVLLDTWAPDQIAMDREDALVELAYRYFRSHGPASMRDFAGWSGLTFTDCRRAVKGNDGRLTALDCEGLEVWVAVEIAGQLRAGEFATASATVVLPGFDEFMLGYKDRTLQAPEGWLDRIVPGGNGVFRSTICVDGLVVGTWTRRLRASRVDVAVELFGRQSAAERRRIDEAFEGYGRFLGLPIQIATTS